VTNTFPRSRLIGVALLLSTCAAPAVFAADTGVDALVKQAQYWRSKGREDLAQQALQRAKALAPDSAQVKGALSAPPPPRTPARPIQAARDNPPQAPRPQTVGTSARHPAAPALVPDRSGVARAGGFEALQGGDLTRAGARFEQALAVNRRDADALGGLGIVRLRQSRFAEAYSLLDQASRLGRAEQWAEALTAARFYAGVAEARGLVGKGRLPEAQDLAEQLVRSNFTDTAPALELLASIYEQQNRYADAAELYRQASEGKGQDDTRLQLRAVRGRALAAAANGDDLRAESEFQNGLMLDTTDPWIRYEFARFMIKRNRLPEADSLARSLATIGTADALYASALINSDLGRPVEAERLVDRIPIAQRTAPVTALAIGLKTDGAIQQARQMLQQGRGAQGAAALRQLASVRGMGASRLARIADALFDMGDTVGASSIAQSALDAPVTGVDDYDGVVRVLARIGRVDLARSALEKARTMAGNSAEGQRAFLRMSSALAVADADRARLAGRFADSFDILQTAWTAAPDDIDVLTALARLYQSGSMSARAAQTFQLVLTRKPGDRDALLGLAESAQAAGDRSLSEKAQAEALRAFNGDYDVYLTLARVEQARGNEQGAVKLLKQARALYVQSHQDKGIAPGGNPFAGQASDMSNPFRNQPQAAPVNPFALGNGTRLPVTTATYPVGTGRNAYNPAPAAGTMPFESGGQAQAAIDAPAWAGSSVPGTMGAQAGYFDPARAASPVDASASGQYTGDPVMDRLQSEILALSHDNGPRLDVDTSYRNRAGEEGLSALSEVKGSARISTGFAGGRVYASADASVVDAGKPTGSGLARFGRNGTIEAQAIVDKVKSALVQADTQHASGVAFAAGYESKLVQIEAGTTPVGMGETKLTFRAAVTPKLSDTVSAKAFVERKPVTDSVVSYAGARDPVSGELWGQVMRTAAGGTLSYDKDGSGVYGEGRYYRFNGTNVSDNTGFETNIGGYLRAWKSAHSSLTTGINLNYQRFRKSQNYFTFGNGGYFSPQSFLAVGFPIHYAATRDALEVDATLTPGFQSYSENQSPLYPTDAAAQAQLDALKALNSDVRSTYDSLSKTGFALSAQTSLYYRFSPNTRIGGEISYNSFGNYKEIRSGLGLRQSFGSGN
jgi:tetratricopeptide (TPR) repeat protein